MMKQTLYKIVMMIPYDHTPLHTCTLLFVIFYWIIAALLILSRICVLRKSSTTLSKERGIVIATPQLQICILSNISFHIYSVIWQSPSHFREENIANCVKFNAWACFFNTNACSHFVVSVFITPKYFVSLSTQELKTYSWKSKKVQWVMVRT